MSFETEIRVRLTNADYSRLIDEFEWDDGDDVVDITFGLNGIDSMEKDGWIVRIRQTASTASLEYKRRVSELNSTWHEIAVNIDSIEKMTLILDKIGLQLGLLIKRHRRTKTIENIRICLDDVEGLGCFLEAEIVGNDVNENRTNLLKAKLASFGIKDNNLADTYGDLLIKKIKGGRKFREQYEAKIKEYFSNFKLRA